MSLNEIHDMKMNDDDNITSYFVRIYQLIDQVQAIEKIISEKELVNIVLNGQCIVGVLGQGPSNLMV